MYRPRGPGDWTIALTNLAERLEKLYSAVVYDTMTSAGLTDRALPPEITSLYQGRKVAGPVWTLSGSMRSGVSIDDTLLSWTGFLSAAPPGQVIVCQPNDHTIAHMGELSAETLQLRGVRGFVVDGGCRDVEMVNALGFPVFCRYATPADVSAGWMVDSMGEPVEIGGLTIISGDYVLGDADGVVVIPAAQAEAIVAEAEQVANTEDALREAIRQGEDPQEAYKRYRVF